MQLARWTKETKPSFIREILKFSTQPDVISFAGGLPAPELFPTAELNQALTDSLTTHGASVLQYSISEGDPLLRQHLSTSLTARRIPAGVDDIILTNGSQHGLDLIAKALVEPGDVVLVEDPTYLGALQAMRPYRPNFVAVASDGEGMIPEALADAIRRENPKLVYIVPTFSNPRGTTMGVERRKKIVAACREADVALVEDEPYAELRYRGEELPGLRHFWDEVIYLGTFSKTLAPALRLGWVVAPPSLMPAIRLGLQATCLNVGALLQRAAAIMLGGGFQRHLASLRTFYAERLDCMLGEMEASLPAGTTWSRPDGGLFIWADLPEDVRTMELVQLAVDRKVAFVPGVPFFVGKGGESSMRLNFSNSTPEQIRVGMARLKGAIEAQRAGR